MKYYAYVGRSSGVYTDWKKVHNLMAQYPFSSVRKFYNEEAAWNYVNTHKAKGNHAIRRVGFTFTEHAIEVEYFIEDGHLYFNLHVPEDFDIKLKPPANSKYILTLNHVYMFHYTDYPYNEESAMSHAKALYNIVELCGPIVDINVDVYDDTLYYITHYYTGYNQVYSDLNNLLKTRIGEVAFVYDRYRNQQDFEFPHCFTSTGSQTEGSARRTRSDFGFEEV